MITKFNVFEILQIAEQIEHKAAKFYLKAAEKFLDHDLRDIYYGLATIKAKHEKLWSRMRKRFSEQTGEFGTFDPNNYVLSNPQVMASLTWSGTHKDSQNIPTGHENKKQIFKNAIRRENEVIVFYQGLKDFARDPASEETIERIIKEAKRQIQMLQEQMQQS